MFEQERVVAADRYVSPELFTTSEARNFVNKMFLSRSHVDFIRDCQLVSVDFRVAIVTCKLVNKRSDRAIRVTITVIQFDEE